ncbi:MAG: hypothetical protein V3S98_10615, partial [Dehalococcoidia bacterium]
LEKWTKPGKPVTARVVGLSWKQTQEVFQEYCDALIPEELVESWGDKQKGFARAIKFWNGSYLGFATVEQGPDMHQGVRCNIIIYDEEPTWEIYEEGMHRTTREGEAPIILFTMTPTKGKGWVWDELVEKRHERDVVYITSSRFENGEGICLACKTPRAEWDAILTQKRMTRNPSLDPIQGGLWMNLQMQATMDERTSREEGYCWRCWTFGIQPRISAKWVKRTLTRTPNPRRVAMRFLGSWENLDGEAVFDHERITAVKAFARAPKITDGTSRQVWEPWMPRCDFVVGVDCARGVGRDETVFCVVNAHTGQQVALWGNSDIKFTEYQNDLVNLAEDYGDAFCVIEDRGGGESIIPHLETKKNIPLYAQARKDRKGNVKTALKVGFTPTEIPRSRILSNMIGAVNKGLRRDGNGVWRVVPGVKGAVYINDPETARQLGRAFYDEKGKIRVPHGENSHDDRIIALALAIEGINHPQTSRGLRSLPTEPINEILHKIALQNHQQIKNQRRGPWARM